MDDFQIDARKWRFLDNPVRYIKRETGGLHVEPLARQFRTTKEILSRLADGRGVLLADDVGLGKTTVGALVAWVVACQNKRVRIYAPNDILRRRWAEELERHVPMLNHVNIDARKERVKQIGKIRRIASGGDANGAVRLHLGRIQVATHHSLIRSLDNNEQRTACDLMIIDEAHRAKQRI
jgi:RecG-like helicase